MLGDRESASFHRALHLSYPSAADRQRAAKLGVSAGGDVEIHGLGAKFGWVAPTTGRCALR